MSRKLILLFPTLLLILTACSLNRNVTNKEPLQRQLIEPVKKQVVNSGFNYSSEDVQEVLDLITELLK